MNTNDLARNFLVYKEYLALNMHFSEKRYDYFKYRGAVRNANIENFLKRKDKIFFAKLAKRDDFFEIILANLVEKKGEKIWIKDLTEPSAIAIYEGWLKRYGSLTRCIQIDLSKFDEDFNSNFRVENGQLPNIISLYMADEICTETVVVLFDLMDLYNYYGERLEGNILYDNMKLFLCKYAPFLNYDKQKVRKLIQDKFS